jgi:hypothetical protein
LRSSFNGGSPELAVAPCWLFRPPIRLDQIQFAAVRFSLTAVGQLSGQTAAIKRALAASEVASLSRSLTCPRCVDSLVDNLLCD